MAESLSENANPALYSVKSRYEEGIALIEIEPPLPNLDALYWTVTDEDTPPFTIHNPRHTHWGYKSARAEGESFIAGLSWPHDQHVGTDNDKTMLGFLPEHLDDIRPAGRTNEEVLAQVAEFVRRRLATESSSQEVA